LTARGATVLAATLALLSAPAGSGEVAEAGLDIPRVGAAAELYARNCQGCHGHKGITVPEVPTLRDRVGWFLHTPEGRDYIVQVPGVAFALVTDDELAKVLNWMLSNYSREQLPAHWRPYTAREVGALRRKPLGNVSDKRQDVIAELVSEGVIPEKAALSFGARPDR
jgi:mono/diheme cytochrome c family protein